MSIVCVIADLNLIQRYLQYRSIIETPLRPNDNPPTEKIITKGETGNIYIYVFGSLLSQGLQNKVTHFACCTKILVMFRQCVFQTLA